MWNIIRALEGKGAALRIVNLGIDTATPTGKLMLNVLGGVAQFEREMMLERQREGRGQVQGPEADGAGDRHGLLGCECPVEEEPQVRITG